MNWSLFFLLLLVNPKHYDKVRQLYEDYHDHSVRLARSELCRHGWSNYYNDAEDVVQNAFKRILKYGKKINFEFEPQYLKGYVCRVTCNEVIRFLEQNKKHIQDLSDNIDAVYTGKADTFTQIKVTVKIQKRFLLVFWSTVDIGEPNNEWIATSTDLDGYLMGEFDVNSTGTYRAVFTIEVYGTGGVIDVMEETIECTY